MNGNMNNGNMLNNNQWHEPNNMQGFNNGQDNMSGNTPNNGGNKKDPKTATLVVLLIVVIVAFAGYVFLTNKKNNDVDKKDSLNGEVVETSEKETNKEENVNQEEQPKQEEQQKQEEQPKQEEKKETEVEISDSNLVADLSKKANTLVSYGTNTTSNRAIKIDGFYVYYKSFSFSDTNKYYISIAANVGKAQKITQKIYDAKIKKYYEKTKDERFSSNEISSDEYGDDGFLVSIIDGSHVSDTYANLFGSSSNIMKKDGDTISGCPSYTYIKDTNVFVVSYACGGTGNPEYYTYQYKFTQKGDYAYVYFAALKADIYNEDGAAIYSGGLAGKTGKKIEDYKEDKDYTKEIKNNYNKYTKYVLTFKKDANGKYIYQSGKSL